jgi:hypothetical protein
MQLPARVGDLLVATAILIFCAHALAQEKPPASRQEKPAPRTDAGDKAVVVAPIPLLEIDPKTNAGTVSVLVRNPSTELINVTLQANSFVDSVSGRTLSAQSSLMKAADSSGASLLVLAVPARETAAAKLSVAGYREPGESTMTLEVNGHRRTVQARFLNVPFNVGVQSAGTDKPRIVLEKDEQGLVVLKNDDATTYPVDWQLFLPESADVLQGSIVLPATSTLPLIIKPPESWFRNGFQGLFKDDTRSAYLALRFAPALVPAPATVAALSLPARTVAVQLDLAYWASFWKAVLGNFIIVLVLVIGAGLSMVLNWWIPNYIRRAELQRRLDRIANDTRQISTATDSRLRVVLRMERYALQGRLYAVVVPGLSSSDALKEVETGTEALQRRVATVIKLDAANRGRDAARGRDWGAPYSLLEEIDKYLNDATTLMAKTVPEEGEFDQVKSAITKAEQALKQLAGANPTFAAKLLEKLKKHIADYDVAGPIGKLSRCKALSKRSPGLFSVLSRQYDDADKLDPTLYHELDMDIQKLNVLRDFLLAAEAIDNDPHDTKGQALVKDLERPLLEELRKNHWRALVAAWKTVSQIKQRVRTSEIEQAILGSQARIELEPSAVYANEPVRLRVALTNPAHDTSAARDELACTWTFVPEVSPEKGWEITHFFRKPDEMYAMVSFADATGQPIRVDPKDPKTTVELTPRPGIKLLSRPKGGSSDAAKVEWLRLSLALALAIMGLIVGAREQFMKLDVFFGLLAVLLLGFSADTIKNLFAKKG